VLGNDSDIDSPSLTAVLVAGPSHGTLTLNANGSFTYTPSANYNGSDSFTYKANDGALDSNVATVSFTVTEVNDAPTGVNDSLSSVAEDSGARTITFASLLANDLKGPANESGQTLTITAVGSAVGGTVAISGTNVVFTLTPDFKRRRQLRLHAPGQRHHQRRPRSEDQHGHGQLHRHRGQRRADRGPTTRSPAWPRTRGRGPSHSRRCWPTT